MNTRKIKTEIAGITLIALVITIIVLLILAGVSISTLIGDNGLLTKASEAKIETAVGAVKEAIQLEQLEKSMDGKEVNPETLLAEGKVQRIVQQGEDGKYYMYYALKEESYEGMQGIGKGTVSTLRDVFLIDDEFHVKYIDKSGKEYGDNINNKILEDETEIRFASKAFSEYVSRISGVKEEEMKFKWMKNQSSLTIEDSSVDSLEDLVFFPNLTSLTLNGTQVITLNGVENCTKISTIKIISGLNKDYTALVFLPSLTNFSRSDGNDYDSIIDALKFCNKLEVLTIEGNQINDMNRIAGLGNLKSLNLKRNQITKIEGLENKPSLESLDLSSNKITRIEGLENLINLKNLYLNSNQITDITPLGANASLVTLDLKENEWIDGNRSNYTGERLEKLNKIGEILDRGGTISLDVDKLSLFTNYKKLNLVGQKLTTLEPLEGLTELTGLVIYLNQLTLEDEKSQEILKSMTNLTELNLSFNKITNVTAINSLKKLKNLSLLGAENNINLVEIEDIISNLNQLVVSTKSLKTIVNCDANKITKLIVSSCDLTEIPDLSKFTKLNKLSLYNNPNITDLSVISKLTNLQSLDLGSNNLHGRVVDFSKLTNLTNLNLSKNTLWTEDLENLKALKNNRNLAIDLSNNSIIDAGSLLVLDTSCRIYLGGNVNLTQESKDALKARFGSNVTF